MSANASFSSAWKADNKRRIANGKATRTFPQYKADHARMAAARAARGASEPVAAVQTVATPKRVSKVARLEAELAELKAMIAGASVDHEIATVVEDTPAPSQDFERITHRVDCFGANKTGVVTLAVDATDAKKAERALKGLYCLNSGVYESKGRGQRVRLTVQQNQIEKCRKALVSAGLTPAGARGWKRAGVSL